MSPSKKTIAHSMASSPIPEGVFSFLDTDLYKLTMQCAVLQFFPSVEVEYTFTNRTPHMRLNTEAFTWLKEQVAKLENIVLSTRELRYLRRNCPFLHEEYLNYLQNFRLRPDEQVKLSFTPTNDDYGDVHISTLGLWVETILYEIPILALTSEAYFKFCDQNWSHEGQEEKAYDKGITLLKNGCVVSDFGSRRRRDLQTHDLVIRGLVRAAKEQGLPGKLTGTSNVYLAMEHCIPPVGTVAHEWYMGIAAITNDYENANELALRYWLSCFGEGVLGIALTDTFGTPAFFKAFSKPVPSRRGSTGGKTEAEGPSSTYAHIFTGIRQDSGDPEDYVRIAREFYDSIGIQEPKTLTFSDSLNTDRCIRYKTFAEKHGFNPTFGVGTFLTNDFTSKTDPGTKSEPLNIVIKLSSAAGRPAIKISDNIGKNTGDHETVQRVKEKLGYTEKQAQGMDEAHRW